MIRFEKLLFFCCALLSATCHTSEPASRVARADKPAVRAEDPDAASAPAAPAAETSESSAELCAHFCKLLPSFADDTRKAPAIADPAAARTPLVVSFVNPGAAPSYEQLSFMQTLHDTLSREGIAVGTVLVVTHDAGRRADAEQMVALALHGEAKMLVLYDEREQLAASFGTRRYPETWVIDRATRLRARFDGSLADRASDFSTYLADVARDRHCEVRIRSDSNVGGVSITSEARVQIDGPGATDCTRARGA